MTDQNSKDLTDNELFEGERMDHAGTASDTPAPVSDEEVNEKYIKGDIRIVTEQARYPIHSVVEIVENPAYRITPEYQRRHRWTVERKSRLIESLIMNVPIPPIFLYEYDYSKYEVMDGLQRLTAIHDFYRNGFRLDGLTEWTELNGRSYEELPEKIREGIDRRYLSSVILLKETARDSAEAQRLKQLVFERINSGGVKLEPQETRNAIFDGPLNHLCLKLSRTGALCRLWGIPEPSTDEDAGEEPAQDRVDNPAFRQMTDVELVLRFFAYRQKNRLQRSGDSLRDFLDEYLRRGNSFPASTLSQLENHFLATIQAAEDIFGERAFYLYRRRVLNGQEHWHWYERPTFAAYDPLMYVLSHHLPYTGQLKERKEDIQRAIPEFYRKNYDVFEGRNVNQSALEARENSFRELLAQFID